MREALPYRRVGSIVTDRNAQFPPSAFGLDQAWLLQSDRIRRRLQRPGLLEGVGGLEEKGLGGVRDRILVSDRAHVNIDLHSLVDGLQEVELGEKKIGTTRRGIGPAYATNAGRK